MKCGKNDRTKYYRKKIPFRTQNRNQFFFQFVVYYDDLHVRARARVCSKYTQLVVVAFTFLSLNFLHIYVAERRAIHGEIHTSNARIRIV